MRAMDAMRLLAAVFAVASARNSSELRRPACAWNMVDLLF